METVLIIIFAGLTFVFLVLWLAGCSRSDDYSKLANEIHGINEKIHGMAAAKSSVSIESFREALLYNGYSPEDPASDDPDRQQSSRAAINAALIAAQNEYSADCGPSSATNTWSKYLFLRVSGR